MLQILNPIDEENWETHAFIVFSFFPRVQVTTGTEQNRKKLGKERGAPAGNLTFSYKALMQLDIGNASGVRNTYSQRGHNLYVSLLREYNNIRLFSV